MKQLSIILFYITIAKLSILPTIDIALAQCSGAPSYTINLTGKPDSVWTSSSVSRGGSCCSVSNCVEFVVTLDSMTSGIKLEITSGAVPGGALSYNIGCSGSYSMGQNVCVSGVGPHHITFCKNGGNSNTYRITSIKKSQASGSSILNQSCTGTLISSGYIESSITWNSVPNNPTHNSLLSCVSACDTVLITPSGTMPSSISYRACGTLLNGCSTSTSCDTISVAFVTNTSVDISPIDPIMCYGQTNTTITATGTGGYPPYHYSWNNGASTPNITVGNGTYIVSMYDSANCMIVKDTVTVTTYNTPIIANAGIDTTICIQNNSIPLSGSVILAQGALWQGGMGSFAPTNSIINPTYTPTQQEKDAGQITLYLMTDMNGNCIGDTDDITIFFHSPPATSLIADTLACAQQSYTYSTNNISGATRQWSVSGGIISGADTGTSVNIIWGNTGTGVISIKQTDNTNGCESTVSKSIILHDKPIFKPIQHH